MAKIIPYLFNTCFVLISLFVLFLYHFLFIPNFLIYFFLYLRIRFVSKPGIANSFLISHLIEFFLRIISSTPSRASSVYFHTSLKGSLAETLKNRVLSRLQTEVFLRQQSHTVKKYFSQCYISISQLLGNMYHETYIRKWGDQEYFRTKLVHRHNVVPTIFQTFPIP